MIGCDMLVEKKDLRKIVYYTKEVRSEKRHESLKISTGVRAWRQKKLTPAPVAKPSGTSATHTLMATPTPQDKPRSHWDTPKRSRVLTLLDLGFSKHETSRRTGAPRSTITTWAHDPHERRSKVRSGRPQSLNTRDIRLLIRILRSGWEGRRLCWARLTKEAGLSVSGRTVQRALEKEGYTRCKACKRPFVSKECQKDRLQYALQHIQKPKQWWRSHMYSDECTFDTSKRGSPWVTRLQSERYHDDCIQHTFHSG